MQTKLTGRLGRGVALLGLVSVLYPGLTEAEVSRQAPPTVAPIAVLGVTPAKELGVVPMSVRNPNFPHDLSRDATGDTYDAAGLIQDTVDAFFIDDLPDNHTFGTGDETAGLNLLSGVDTRIVGTDLGPGLPGTNRLQVNYFTTDGSDLVPEGILNPDGQPFLSWRFDLGTTAAGIDKIEWSPNPGFTVVDSGICLLQDGAVLECFPLFLDDSDANGVSGLGVVGLGGEDIAGFGLDEIVMFWEIQLEGSLIEDLDGDGDVDLLDAQRFLNAFTGPIEP